MSATKGAEIDVSLGLELTHVLVTGGRGLIGSVVVQAFLAAGAWVTSLDVKPPNGALNERHFELVADTTDEKSLGDAFGVAVKHNGPVKIVVALAALDLSVLDQHDSSTMLSAAEWRRTIDVNVTGTFLTAREWLRGISLMVEEDLDASVLKNISLIIVGSESGQFGERTCAAYATSKSAVQGGLMLSLAADAPRIYPGARVNAVAPGPVDTARFRQECKDNPFQYYADAQGTVPLCRPVPPEDVARTILFLASENLSGSVHGQVIQVTGGKQGKVLWSEAEAAKRGRNVSS